MYSYDDIAQVTTVMGSKSSQTTQYVKSASYTPYGALDTLRLNGDNLRERYQYDPNRLQLTSLTVAQCPDAGCSLPVEKLYLGLWQWFTSSPSQKEKKKDPIGRVRRALVRRRSTLTTAMGSV